MLESLTNEQRGYLREQLSGLLPECFRLHCRLLKVADPVTNEVRSSLSDLASAVGYDGREIYFFLSFLDLLGFVKLTRSSSSDKHIRIKIRVRY
jgi:hypothetical protein